MDNFALTWLRIALTATEPAPPKVWPPARPTAIAAICTSRPGGRVAGWANVASRTMSPVAACTVALSTSALVVLRTLLIAKATPAAPGPPGDTES